MYRVIYSKQALKDLNRIPKETAEKIQSKVVLYATEKGLRHTAKIKGAKSSLYRFKTGRDRVMFERNHATIYILTVFPLQKG